VAAPKASSPVKEDSPDVDEGFHGFQEEPAGTGTEETLRDLLSGDAVASLDPLGATFGMTLLSATTSLSADLLDALEHHEDLKGVSSTVGMLEVSLEGFDENGYALPLSPESEKSGSQSPSSAKENVEDEPAAEVQPVAQKKGRAPARKSKATVATTETPTVERVTRRGTLQAKSTAE